MWRVDALAIKQIVNDLFYLSFILFIPFFLFASFGLFVVLIPPEKLSA